MEFCTIVNLHQVSCKALWNMLLFGMVANWLHSSADTQVGC